MKPEPYELTDVDLIELRVRMRYCGFIRDGSEGVMLAGPWTTYLLASHEYVLHNQGFVIAITPRDDLACCLLRNERIEPGFCRRILDPRFDPQTALTTPEERHAWSQARYVDAARAKLQREEAEEAARRRRSQLRAPDPLTLSIEDLLS